MTAISLSIRNGVDGFKQSDFTVGTSAPGALDIELRWNQTDGTHNITAKGLLVALLAFRRAIETDGGNVVFLTGGKILGRHEQPATTWPGCYMASLPTDHKETTMPQRELTRQEQILYGADAVIDPATDTPIFQGRGAQGRETIQHLQALEKARAAVPAGDGIPTRVQLEEALALVAAATNPEAHVARINKLSAIAQEARSAVAEAASASRDLNAKRLEHLKRMSAEKSELMAMLAGERAQFDAERKVRFADLNEREASLAKRETALAARIAEVNDRQAKLDRGLAAAREAAR